MTKINTVISFFKGSRWIKSVTSTKYVYRNLSNFYTFQIQISLYRDTATLSSGIQFCFTEFTPKILLSLVYRIIVICLK